MNAHVLDTVLFYMLAAGAAGLALAMVLSRHILRSAVFLMGTLGFIAGLYVVLSAPFLAAVQVLVYIGGIVVLFILAVMLSSNTELLDDVTPPGRRLLGLLASGLYLGLNIVMCVESPFVAREPGAMPADIDALAQSFMGRGPSGYLVPFELLSLLILGAAVGGIVLARKTLPPDRSATRVAPGSGKEPRP